MNSLFFWANIAIIFQDCLEYVYKNTQYLYKQMLINFFNYFDVHFYTLSDAYLYLKSESEPYVDRKSSV